MIPANRVDRDLIATPTASAVAVPVGDELVLVDGWTLTVNTLVTSIQAY